MDTRIIELRSRLDPVDLARVMRQHEMYLHVAAQSCRRERRGRLLELPAAYRNRTVELDHRWAQRDLEVLVDLLHKAVSAASPGSAGWLAVSSPRSLKDLKFAPRVMDTLVHEPDEPTNPFGLVDPSRPLGSRKQA